MMCFALNDVLNIQVVYIFLRNRNHNRTFIIQIGQQSKYCAWFNYNFFNIENVWSVTVRLVEWQLRATPFSIYLRYLHVQQLVSINPNILIIIAEVIWARALELEVCRSYIPLIIRKINIFGRDRWNRIFCRKESKLFNCYLLFKLFDGGFPLCSHKFMIAFYVHALGIFLPVYNHCLASFPYVDFFPISLYIYAIV